jgi:4-hydroxy-tetrahydrodipicolinate reductase
MPINVLVNGAFGRMGQLTVKTLSASALFNVVGQTGREYDLTKSIKDSGAEVVVDFTRADVVFANASTIIEAGARPVIGTSGLTVEQIQQLEKKCAAAKLGGIIAPNFSLGAVLMMKYAAEIAKYMPNIEIIEMHHDKKADSPSGTSMRTAELLAKAAGQSLNQAIKPAHETVPGSRGANYQGIPIHAVRLPGFLAHQQIIFGSTGETLTLRHDSIDRESFMPGIRLACEKVMQLDRLVYGLEGIL